jgi:triosephosphate isomerase
MSSSQKKLIVGNWKMNLTVHEASLYLHKLAESIPVRRDVEVVIAPTLLALQPLSLQVNRRQFKLAVQNFYWRDDGAFTGEVSASQLRAIADYAIIGHSERRHIFHESEKDIRNKVQAAIRNRMKPILCIGETAHERSEGETEDVLHEQIISGLANITSEEVGQLIIAYEPVWAISNGKDFVNHAIATPSDAARAAASIRKQVAHLYGKAAAEDVRVLYGGSANADNATGFLQAKGIDGLLVGGASLKYNEFIAIVDKAHGEDTETKA